MYERPAFMKRCTRHPYADPQGVGWAAWWELLPGVVVAFEHLDGTIIYQWGDDADVAP